VSDVRIKVRAGGGHIEYAGSQGFFDRLIAPLIDAAYRREWGAVPDGSPAALPVTPPRGPVFRPASPQHFSHYAGQVGARAASVDQRIMAFAFYLWNFERQDEIFAEDLRGFFRTVLEEPPGDLQQRLVALCNAQRFLQPGDAAESWRLTTKGLNYVKNRLLAPVPN